MADEILRAAEKLLAAKSRLQRASEEYETAQIQYRETIANLMTGANGSNGNAASVATGGAALTPTVSAGTLRDRIVQYLMQHPGVPLSVTDIERAIGAEADHKRLIWTLANMKRDGAIKHESRGQWSWKSEERPKEEDDPEF